MEAVTMNNAPGASSALRALSSSLDMQKNITLGIISGGLNQQQQGSNPLRIGAMQAEGKGLTLDKIL